MRPHQAFIANYYSLIFSSLFIAVIITITPLMSKLPPNHLAFDQSDNLKLELLQPSLLLETPSKFKETTTTQLIPIPFDQKTVIDSNLDFGLIKIIQEGKVGQAQITTKTLFYDGQFYSQERTRTQITPPQDQIVAIGRKKNLQIIETEFGQLEAFAKLKVYATAYDKNCHGCNETTALGLKAGFGVVAVDPTIIPLGTKLYIPGYGLAIAGDTGGAVKGYIIDLGFDNVKTANWRARHINVYLIN